VAAAFLFEGGASTGTQTKVIRVHQSGVELMMSVVLGDAEKLITTSPTPTSQKMKIDM
jgi:hypothetical protein